MIMDKDMIYDDVLAALGHTPLIRLRHIASAGRILVKYEGVNVGGSIKTRTAANMLAQARSQGKIGPDTVIVEATSGNQGIGLALIGAVKGYHVVIIMPDSVSQERRLLIRHYGAEVILIHDEGNIGECVKRCQNKAQQMAAEDPRVYLPQQFSNPANVQAHYEQTAAEILAAMDGHRIDGFCSGVGTGGTITGIGQALRKANPDIRIWAVEPDKAAILSGGTVGDHIQMGIGDGLIPAILDTGIYDATYRVTDAQALDMARCLARQEGLMCGISSGSNVCGAVALSDRLGPSSTVITILPDTAERYFSTDLFAEDR